VAAFPQSSPEVELIVFLLLFLAFNGPVLFSKQTKSNKTSGFVEGCGAALRRPHIFCIMLLEEKFETTITKNLDPKEGR